MTKNVVLVIGLPGSGKSTLSQQLKSETIDVVSSSSLLDNLPSEERIQLKDKYIDKGIDIPDNIYVEMIVSYITQSQKEKFVIEGFPYNLNQRALSNIFFKMNDIDISSIVYLKIKKEMAVSRILNRRVCPLCHKTFSNNEVQCDQCGCETEIRKDDRKSIAIERINNLSVFLDEIVEYYKKTKNFIEFNEQEMDVESFFDLFSSGISIKRKM